MSTATTKVTINSETVTGRQALRESIYNEMPEMDIRPIDIAEVVNWASPEYREIAAKAVESGEETTIEVDISFDMLRSLIAANGANRESTPSHYTNLAFQFLGQRDEESGDLADERTGYLPAMSKLVISKDGFVVDGGHSLKALASAYFPLHLWHGIHTQEVMEAVEGVEEPDPENPEHWVTVEETVYPSLGKFEPCVATDEQGNRMLPYGDDESFGFDEAEEIAAERRSALESRDRLRMVCTINAPTHIAQKLAEARLNIDVPAILNMCPPVRAHMERIDISAELAAQVINGWRLRSDCSVDKDGEMRFGKMNKGGRPNNAEAPVWYLTIAPKLVDALSLLRNEHGQVDIPNCLKTGGDSPKWALSFKDILVAMCCLDSKGQKRLAKALDGSKNEASNYAKALAPFLLKPSGADKFWSKAKTWWIVNSLIAYGSGKSSTVATGFPVNPEKDDNPQDDKSLRASGWDIGESDTLEDGEEIRGEVMAELGPIVDELSHHAEKAAESLNRKRKK